MTTALRARGWAAPAHLFVLTLSLATAAGAQQPTGGTLAVRDGGVERIFWRADQAPARWTTANPIVERALHWRASAPGVQWALLRLAGEGEAWRTGVVVVRIDPRVQAPRLVVDPQPDGRMRPWSAARIAGDALVAFNGGHFTNGRPWGWLVIDGRERQAPGIGPLSSAVVHTSDGRTRIVPWAELAEARADTGVVHALQSYPTLLVGDGDVPPALRVRGSGVNLEHRDSRLAMCELRDGRLLVVLTRFEAFGGALSEIPFGPTLSELAGIMGALGCARAVALDGGISGQLALRTHEHDARRRSSWRGLRSVPLGVEWVTRTAGK